MVHCAETYLVYGVIVRILESTDVCGVGCNQLHNMFGIPRLVIAKSLHEINLKSIAAIEVWVTDSEAKQFDT